MGKKLLLLLFPLLLSALWAATAWADMTDPCDSADGPGSYRGLAPPDQDYINWDDPPDSSYLCQRSNSRTASATYRCPGAEEVTVAIYSRYGSYASRDGETLARGGGQLPLDYQPSTGEVYCGGSRMAYDAELGEFVFLEEADRPSGLVAYGLGIYWSGDGEDYTPADVRLLSARREGPDAYWYEVYQAGLEEGVRYLRLTLTDQSSIEIVGREQRYRFETTGGLSLASVEITGEEETPSSQPWDQSRDPGGDGLEEDPDQEDQEDWEHQAEWEMGEPELPGGSLPAYRPGEEEGLDELPWGPDEDPEDGGPAFPDETEDREPEEPSAPPSPSDPDPASSQSGSKTQKSKAPVSKKKETPAPEEPEMGRSLQGGFPDGGQPEPALRWKLPLWRRALEPDGMAMIIIALTLLAMGIRILWEQGGDSRSRRAKNRELEEREARYARYTNSGRPRSGKGQRHRKNHWDDHWDDD